VVKNTAFVETANAGFRVIPFTPTSILPPQQGEEEFGKVTIVWPGMTSAVNPSLKPFFRRRSMSYGGQTDFLCLP